MTREVMRVSDPCYDHSVWCTGLIFDCMTGKWDAAVQYSHEGGWGTRVSRLIAKHESLQTYSACDKIRVDEENIYFPHPWEDSHIVVGVDSGQAGVFDDSKYQDESIFAGLPAPTAQFGDSIWYNQCCTLTLSEKQAGAIPCGAVSSSGLGDGTYTALKHLNKDHMVDCVMIVFL